MVSNYLYLVILIRGNRRRFTDSIRATSVARGFQIIIGNFICTVLVVVNIFRLKRTGSMTPMEIM
jgi:hypothetical protein